MIPPWLQGIAAVALALGWGFAEYYYRRTQRAERVCEAARKFANTRETDDKLALVIATRLWERGH